MRARLKGSKLVKLRYIIDGGVGGVLQNGVGFASVGFDGSLWFQGIEFGSDLISDPHLHLVARPARLRHRQLFHHHVVSLSLSIYQTKHVIGW